MANMLVDDIFAIQWMVSSHNDFVHVYELLEKKYSLGLYSIEEKLLIEKFFVYHRKQWRPESHVGKWYEAANPFSIGSNQGVESKNNIIKKDYTYRDRLDTADFMEQAERICEDDSKKDDSTLEGHRLLYVTTDMYGNKQQDSFSLQETGFQYYNENLKKLPSGKRTPGRLLEVRQFKKLKCWNDQKGDLKESQ